MRWEWGQEASEQIGQTSGAGKGCDRRMSETSWERGRKERCGQWGKEWWRRRSLRLNGDEELNDCQQAYKSRIECPSTARTASATRRTGERQHIVNSVSTYTLFIWEGGGVLTLHLQEQLTVPDASVRFWEHPWILGSDVGMSRICTGSGLDLRIWRRSRALPVPW